MFTPLNTFDDVVARYESTKAMDGVRFKYTDNIRPIGSRARPFERIAKIDDNTYVLSDGNYDGFGKGTARLQALTTGGAILWKREADGDYIHIRNSPKGSTWPSRSLFLSGYLPTAMRFITGQQAPYKQQVYVHGKAHPLIPLRTKRVKEPVSGDQTVVHDPDVSLVFKVMPDGTYVRSNLLTVSTTKVDRERKKSMALMFDEFYEYMLTMAPFADADWGSTRRFDDHLEELGLYVDDRDGREEIARHFITAPIEDEGKVLFASMILYLLNYRWVSDGKGLKEFRKRYNKWCTDTFDLYVKETV